MKHRVYRKPQYWTIHC